MTPDLAGLRLDDPDLIADPYPVYQALRERHPVLEYPALRAWLVSRHEDVRAILLDHHRFTADEGRHLKGIVIFPPDVQARNASLAETLGRMMLFHDPPEQTRLRRHLGPRFHRDRVATLRDHIHAITHRLLDGFTGGRADVVAQLAHPLPAQVICELLGVPDADRERLVGWADDLAEHFVAAPPTVAQLDRAGESTRRMVEYFVRLYHDRKGSAGVDLVTHLSGFAAGAEPIDDREVAAQCVLLMFGGQETTRNLIANALNLLLRHPDQWDAVRADRSLLPAAVNEVLRYETPVQWVARSLKKSVAGGVELHGATIRPEDNVLLLIGAANRDPAVFADPERFVVGRVNAGDHLGFGAGVHRCVGEAIAKLEAEVSLGAIADRFPGLRLAGETPPRTTRLALRGLQRLLVEW